VAPSLGSQVKEHHARSQHRHGLERRIGCGAARAQARTKAVGVEGRRGSVTRCADVGQGGQRSRTDLAADAAGGFNASVEAKRARRSMARLGVRRRWGQGFILAGKVGAVVEGPSCAHPSGLLDTRIDALAARSAIEPAQPARAVPVALAEVHGRGDQHHRLRASRAATIARGSNTQMASMAQR